MLIDFNVSTNNLPESADFCVVGSGPAGMTVAMQLEDYGRSVILLEGGGLFRSSDSQEIYKGDVIGDQYPGLEFARLRYFGGTSGHWGGWCYQLPENIFLDTKGFYDAYWPISKQDLAPFLSKACTVLDIPIPPDPHIVDHEFGIHSIDISVSTVRFGEKYRETLASSQNITCVTNANLTGLETDGRNVVAATVKNFLGNSVRIKAKHFILAMGGIENSRMLLWCNHQANGSLVDQKAPLGRYWMEHPTMEVGYALVDFSFKHSNSQIQQLVLGLDNAVKGKLSVLDCSFILNELTSVGTKGLVKDLLCVAPTVGEWIASKANKNIVCGARLEVEWEQEPVWTNHVRLSGTERDRFGIPLTELHWEKTDRDLATVEKSLSYFNEYLIKRNRGRIKLDPKMRGGEELGDGVFGMNGYAIGGTKGVSFHHMGGTRMAQSVEKGVVDSNCRVFGQNNLYVAGSSVFPAGGAANPTLTIVQLSLRLAKHLQDA